MLVKRMALICHVKSQVICRPDEINRVKHLNTICKIQTRNKTPNTNTVPIVSQDHGGSKKVAVLCRPRQGQGENKAAGVPVPTATLEKLSESYISMTLWPQRGHSPSPELPHWLSKSRRFPQAHPDGFQRSHSCQQLCWPGAKGGGPQRGDGLCWHTRHQGEGHDACL